ncbi:hypothetical protein MMAN_52310 [Mycobacterium mantenii]|uniref:DUF4245 domain-containing protein n=1 Tax=Mycobacterium mantenii TaxID=560555 RepID=A0A1X0FGT9_MYCNT|nr:hypothetical protein [Mycobacterium mantenii]MCV7244754.1 hypothetical protein [Mycobacterium mantenii]ORB00963.1 hypothetical protein BST30_22240 [Mycobacterium mantenii]BBY41097.1 hypothetical protein MMAN_52310 [Mycobacterium mantenii]
MRNTVKAIGAALAAVAITSCSNPQPVTSGGGTTAASVTAPTTTDADGNPPGWKTWGYISYPLHLNGLTFKTFEQEPFTGNRLPPNPDLSNPVVANWFNPYPRPTRWFDARYTNDRDGSNVKLYALGWPNTETRTMHSGVRANMDSITAGDRITDGSCHPTWCAQLGTMAGPSWVFIVAADLPSEDVLKQFIQTVVAAQNHVGGN